MDLYNPHQYEDLVNREQDPYAHTKYNIILDTLNTGKPLNILNIGCGSGELCILLAEQGHTVVGVDPVKEYIDLAEKRFGSLKLKGSCTFSVATIEEYHSDTQFDCVMATDVIEHIEDDATAVVQLEKLLKPGGTLVITVPALQGLFGYHDEILGHFRRYTRSSLTKLLREHTPMSKIAIRYFGFTLIPVCWLYSKKLRKPYPMTQGGGMKLLRDTILKALLFFDKTVPMPLGTSLLCFAKKKLKE